MRFVFLFLILISMTCLGQYKSFKISPRGDTLNRIDMKGQKQGPWIVHVDELRGEPGYEEEGYFKNDKKEGQWRHYDLEGILLSMENYRWGNKDGKNRYYTRFGALIREESWKAVNPDNPYDTVPIYNLNDPTKVDRMEVIKLEGYTLKHGTWTFYDPDFGTITKTEKWFLDKPATGTTDDDLRPIDFSNTNTGTKTSDTSKKTATKPQAVLDFEKKNAGKKKVKVRDGSTRY
jgi:hypothetical protein